MKISVLLPTRNGLKLLPNAVQSVLMQTYDDLEMIIFDNASDQDIKGYIESLHDPRIHYYRTDEFVSVTQNWNNALERASGDYVIMLGDDDCLMPDFCRTIADLAMRYGNPDLIYSDAYLYSYPGIFPEYPNGFLQLGYNTRFRLRAPFLLGRKEALAVVGEGLSMLDPLSYNMQVSTVRREFILSLKARGPFFQSPFPDYYATLATFLMAERILIYQQPIAVIGISPKSFGYFFFNRREGEGVSILNNQQEQALSDLEQFLLPGSHETTCRLIAMEAVAKNYAAEVQQHHFTVDVTRYRRMQMDYNWKAYRSGQITPAEFEAFRGQLNSAEWLAYQIIYRPRRWMYQVLPTRIKNALSRASGHLPIPPRVTHFPTVIDVLRQMPATIKD